MFAQPVTLRVLWTVCLIGLTGATILHSPVKIDTHFGTVLPDCQGLECHQQYLENSDSSYAWEITKTKKSAGWTTYYINMTSQTWLSPNECNTNVWHHHLVIIVPSELDTTTGWAILNVGGGFSQNIMDVQSIKTAIDFATSTHTIAASLQNVPNQPVLFSEDPQHMKRLEGQVRSFTWDMFMKYPDRPEWLAELAMTKAVVRAMDTVTAFVTNMAKAMTWNLGTQPQRFALTGCSKRALAAMFASEVDSRVQALSICNEVMDRQEHMRRSFMSYGGTQKAFEPYFKSNFPEYFDTQQGDRLLAIIDAKTSVNKMTMPKLFISAGNDAFFLPDFDQTWRKELPGESSFLTIPNSDHIGDYQFSSDALAAASNFFNAVIHSEPRPSIQWDVDMANEIIQVYQISEHTPKSVKLWSASSCGAGRRDFRLVTLDNVSECKTCGGVFNSLSKMCEKRKSVMWTSNVIEPDLENTKRWTIKIEIPPDGWKAFFVGFQYASTLLKHPELEVSTDVSVFPNTYPYPRCTGKECFGDHLI